MSNTPGIEWITPDWPAPPAVRALSTCRAGGVSEGPFRSLNLAGHVGDAPDSVLRNRGRLAAAADLPVEPTWLEQVHGCDVVNAGAAPGGACADASIAHGPGAVCAVMTADCLPVIFCNSSGTQVAAAHAGWRGMAGGVLERTVGSFSDDPADLMAWLGPAIGPRAFEVGDEVRDAFVAISPDNGQAFRAGRQGHWFADLYALASSALARAGVTRVAGGGLCTCSDPGRFFSYRRDGLTGRMATLIWIEPRE